MCLVKLFRSTAPSLAFALVLIFGLAGVGSVAHATGNKPDRIKIVNKENAPVPVYDVDLIAR